MADRTALSLMPTVNGRRRPDLHRMPGISPNPSDEEIGEVLGDCLRYLQHLRDQGDLVELNIRFA